jgi:hypothetical protein
MWKENVVEGNNIAMITIRMLYVIMNVFLHMLWDSRICGVDCFITCFEEMNIWNPNMNSNMDYERNVGIINCRAINAIGHKKLKNNQSSPNNIWTM